MNLIDELLRQIKTENGSDLHLSAGLEPRIRKRGSLESLQGWDVLSDDDVRQLLRAIASPEQWHSFERESDLDFAYGLPGVARFRANYFVQQGGAGAVFRIIPEEIVQLEKLRMPPAVEKLAGLEKGLV